MPFSPVVGIKKESKKPAANIKKYNVAKRNIFSENWSLIWEIRIAIEQALISKAQ